MQLVIVIVIVTAALVFMARRIVKQWKGGSSCGCGNDECNCKEGHDNDSNGCAGCPLQNKCNHCH